jgi:hypothetical protein
VNCHICGGPAYVGLHSAECMNPKCAPFDPMSAVTIKQGPPPAPDDRPMDGEWYSYSRVYYNRTDHPERVWWMWCHDRAGIGYPRPTREECFAAWAADHRDFLADHPARLTVRGLVETFPEACERWAKARGIDAGCFFVPDQGGWDAVARSMWEVSR